jgi:hypothetical protein
MAPTDTYEHDQRPPYLRGYQRPAIRTALPVSLIAVPGSPSPTTDIDISISVRKYIHVTTSDAMIFEILTYITSPSRSEATVCHEHEFTKAKSKNRADHSSLQPDRGMD